jgi:hypothetical protein
MSMKPSGLYEPRLTHEQTILWLPSTGTDGSGAGIGPGWMVGTDAVVSHPTPVEAVTTKFRRARFTSPAISDKHLGILFANAGHKCCYRGSTESKGGYYFRAVFMVNAIPNTAIRFFCGLSEQVGTGLAVSDTVPANSTGLWCDDGDAGNLTVVQCDSGGTAEKTALTGTPRTLTAGTLYEWIMIQGPAQNPVVTQLNNLGDDAGGWVGTILNSQNVFARAPANAAMMAPQVGLGNAANAAGGDCSLDIISVYVRPNLKLRPDGTT